MGNHNLQFAALVGSRICHDLISPIGAINNGLELLAMSGATQGPEMELIHDSVAAANARIRFFRIAYGSSNDAQMTSAQDVKSVLTDITRGGRTSISWQPQCDLARNEVQLAFLAIQCAEQALPYGGDINVTHKSGKWQISMRAERLLLNPEQWNLFLDQEPNAADTQTMPAHVQFLLLPSFARQLGRSVEFARLGEAEALLTI